MAAEHAADGSVAGLIQVDLALAAKTFISPSVLLLNDTTYLNNVQSITITNQNPYTMWYTLTSAVGQGRGLYGSVSPVYLFISVNG